jgi:hypothetical protein
MTSAAPPAAPEYLARDTPHWAALRAYCRGLQAGAVRAAEVDELAARYEAAALRACELAGAAPRIAQQWLDLALSQALELRPGADLVLVRAVAARLLLLTVHRRMRAHA